MPTFYWTRGTNVVSTQPYDASPAQVQGARGNAAIRLIIQDVDANGTVTPVLLANNQIVGLALRDPDDVGAGYAAGPVTLTRGATAADGYIGTVSTDSSYVRDKMRVGDPDAPELPSFDLNAVFYVLPPVGQATESIPFAWNVQPSYYRAGTPPADILESYPSAAQLTAAVAHAAAAVNNGDSPFFSGLVVGGNAQFPGGIDFPSDAPVTQDGGSIGNCILTLNDSGWLVSVTLAAGQGIRRNAANDAFESYVINSGDGSLLTSLNPANLSAPVGIAKGGTGAATAAGALASLGAEAAANRGAASGYAPLDSSSKVPAANLPSYVDDVLEVADFAALPGTGETGKIYVTLDTNFEYRWSGSTYIRLVPSPGTTDALVEGSTNLYFTTSRALAATADAYAPRHPVSYAGSPGGPTGNGTTINYSGGTSQGTGGTGTTTGFPVLRLSDTCGTLILNFSADVSAGTLVATITFATGYTTQLPADVMFCPVGLSHLRPAASPGGNPSFVPALEARLSSTGLSIYASGDGVANGSTLAYRYLIPSV